MIQDTVAKLKDMFRSRANAYRMVFDEKNQFTIVVLQDLAKFCRAHESSFNKDDRMHAVLEGRREVFLRIQNYLNLETDQLLALHHAKQLTGEHK